MEDTNEIEKHSQLLKSEPDNVDLLLLRADSYIKAAQYGSAINDIEKAGKLKVNNYNTYLRWGIALFHEGKVQAALKKFRLAEVLASPEEKNQVKEWILKCTEKQTHTIIQDPLKNMTAPALDYYLDTQEYESHKALLSFGYYYNQFGQLRSVANKSKYKFTNQKDYEAICKAVITFVQEVLGRYYNALEKWLPLSEDNNGNKGSNNIFISPDFESNTKKCLICIQGSGEVRAGQWARYCCMNDALDSGTVFPLIQRAKEEGYSYIILNPNLNRSPATKERIKDNGTAEEHCAYVWERFVRKCPARELYIVAHSAGGMCTSTLLVNNPPEFLGRVQVVALTDTCMLPGANEEQRKFIRNVTFPLISREYSGLWRTRGRTGGECACTGCSPRLFPPDTSGTSSPLGSPSTCSWTSSASPTYSLSSTFTAELHMRFTVTVKD
eukprot:TRINITY_DN3988_c0_g1_i3.p1 TRINITY_DN3988_c0_g1~~TRINITY_DN3988_c0_g1_i3.p1  ORF type:complete len:440 (-),score=53.52 TRINITY_DN3988_c0_g1_i3:1079-2398(-)